MKNLRMYTCWIATETSIELATCPLCSIQRFSDDDAADVKVLKGMIEQVIRPLLITNGVMPDVSERHVKPLVERSPLIVVRR